MTAEPVPQNSSSEERPEGQLSAAQLVGLHDVGKASPGFQVEVTDLLGAHHGQLRLVGRARKVSVSMPEDLTAAVQQRVGRGEFSHYVTDAVARQLELDLLGELEALLEAQHGPVSDELLAEARGSWPDA
jgi:Arc/MetJ-type ribon-helix-helix transcriptional regulator